MAKHGNTNKLKRLNAPGKVSITKKSYAWLMKPMAGAHKASESVALGSLLRDMLGLATRAREAVKLCNDGKVRVDGRIIRNPKFPISFMDVVELPEINVTYYMDLDQHGRLVPRRENRNFKLLRIVRKNVIKKGKMQLTMSDGRTFLGGENYNVGDTLKVSIPDFKVLGHIPLKVGSKCIIMGGKNAGTRCTLQSITPGTVEASAKATVKADDGEELKTVLHYLYAIE